MDSRTFLDNLKQSRLLSEEQLSQASRLAEGMTAAELPAALVGDGILTPLQAQRVAKGEVRSLVLGPYHLLEEVGRGGMGRVYKAVHTVMGRVVALKLMAPEMAEDARSRERFLREVRSVTRLSHPNIVLPYDANEAEGVLFLAMEYVEGTTLAEVVRSAGPLAVPRACEFMRQAALGLQHAHQKGLVHRDIKPANLLIPWAGGDPSGPAADAGGAQAPALVKIADFGLARLNGLHGAESVAGQTAVGFLGTPDYVAPEQCRDARSIDIRSDLYSLGCTFYFSLTGRPPFGGDSTMEKLFAHVTQPAPPVDERRPDVPPEVAAIVARLLEKDPKRRFQTPLDLAQELTPWCKGADTAPAAPGSRSGPGLVNGGVTRIIESPSDPPPVPWPGPEAGQGWAGSAVDSQATRVVEHSPNPRPSGGALAAVGASPVAAPARVSDSDPGPPAFARPAQPCLAVARPAASPSPPATVDSAATLLTDPVTVGPATDTVPLRLSWARWVEVIDGLVRRRPGVVPGEQAYQELYRALLAGCAQDARQADEETRHRLRYLAELVRPWMSLTTLARTETLLLQDLVGRASEAGRALGFRTASPDWFGWLVLLFLGAVALPFGWRLFKSLASAPEGIFRSVEQALRSWSGVFVGGPTFWVSLLGTGGVLVVLWRLSRRRL